jgi:hypothetical protein
MKNAIVVATLAWFCLPFGLALSAENYFADSSACSCDDSPIGNSCGGCNCPCEAFDCCDCFNDRQRILGMLPSDHCFDGFISPLSNPFFFEDPRSLTEARGLFLDNSLPAAVQGGDVQVGAAQFRGRLTDRWSVIAPRLGYLQVNQAGGNPPAGFMSAPVGVKYNFIRDVEEQFLVSGGMTYFIPGSQGAASSFGGGDFHIFLTAGKEIFDCGHWLSATGFRLPENDNFGTQLWYWSNQWDYELPGHLYPLVGVNWFHWMRNSGNVIGAPVAGLDLINLPVSGVDGTNVVTSVVGLKWKPSCHVELGAGFEFPLTDRTDILHNRAYADLIFRY